MDLEYISTKHRTDIVRAVYIGCGCFKRVDGGELAFVRRVFRPDYLTERTVYELRREAERGGVLYYVHGTAAV